MKYCPQCQKQYTEVWITFCSDDGTILVDTDYAPRPSPPSSEQRPYAPPGYDQPTWRPPDPNAPGGWPNQGNQPLVSPPWQPPPPPAYSRPQQSQGLAIASMVVGVIGLFVGTFCLGPIPGLAALIMGIVALSQIKKAPDRNTGKPFAIIGVVTGSLSVLFYGAFVVLWIIAAIFSH